MSAVWAAAVVAVYLVAYCLYMAWSESPRRSDELGLSIVVLLVVVAASLAIESRLARRGVAETLSTEIFSDSAHFEEGL